MNDRRVVTDVPGRTVSCGARRLLLILIVSSLPAVSCSRYKARHELKRVEVFAEIIRRVDTLSIGEDGFFEKNLTGNPYPEVRRWCALGLARIGSPEALPLLYRGTAHSDASVRAASAFAIGEIEDRDALRRRELLPDPQALVELVRLLDDTSAAVRMRAVEALGKAGAEQEAAEILRRTASLQFTGNPEQRACLGFAITALARLRYQPAASFLTRVTSTGDMELRERATNAMARLQAGSDFATGGQALLYMNVQAAQAPAGLVTDIVSRILAYNRRNRTIAIVETTRGTMEIELFREDAPVTVDQFVKMARGGAYNGLRLESSPASQQVRVEELESNRKFHRVLRNEINMRPFERGSIGAVLSGADSHRGGFFIAMASQPYLEGASTCFGRVVSGLQIAERITPGDRILRVTTKEAIRVFDRITYVQ